MRLLNSLVVMAVALCIGASPSRSHEFWIEPQNYQVKIDEEIVADFRNGQNFEGGALSWFDKRIVRSEYRLGTSAVPILGRSGDSPAISLKPSDQGLLRIVHQTTLSRITYREKEKFQAFVDHKDLDTSDLPDPTYPLAEGYSRFVKSLIAVGHGQGFDDQAGLEIEFVSLKNPYSEDVSKGLPVSLFYQGVPRPNAQVEVFERAPEGAVKISLLRTDPAGRVLIPVKRGHTYLIDAVLLRRPSPALQEERNIHWESLWAALTFAIPN